MQSLVDILMILFIVESLLGFGCGQAWRAPRFFVNKTDEKMLRRKKRTRRSFRCGVVALPGSALRRHRDVGEAVVLLPKQCLRPSCSSSRENEFRWKRRMFTKHAQIFLLFFLFERGELRERLRHRRVVVVQPVHWCDAHLWNRNPARHLSV